MLNKKKGSSWGNLSGTFSVMFRELVSKTSKTFLHFEKELSDSSRGIS